MAGHPIFWFFVIFFLSWLVSLFGTFLTQAIQHDKEWHALPTEWIQTIVILTVYREVVPDDTGWFPILIVATGGALGTFTGIRLRKWRERKKYMHMKRVTSCGAIVRNSGGEILLTRKQGSDFWGFLKGRPKTRSDGKEEQPWETAAREAHEEGGVQHLSFIRPLGAYARPKMNKDGSDDNTVWKTIIMYLYETDEHDVRPADAEHAEARWFSVPQIMKLPMHPADKDFLREVRNMIV